MKGLIEKVVYINESMETKAKNKSCIYTFIQDYKGFVGETMKQTAVE